MGSNVIENIAIIGLGTMGPGMALEFARAGHHVIGFDVNPGAAEASRAVIDATLSTLVEAGHMPEKETGSVKERIRYTDSIESAVENAGVVVEAVSENSTVKQSVFEKIDAHAPEECLVWSNTSTLNIFEMMPEKRLDRTLIAHWFAPPHIIPLVEVVKGGQTSRETLDLTLSLLRGMNKRPIVIEKYVPGFIINRILRNLGREAFFLLDNGYISKEDLDLAIKASIAPRMMVLGLIQRYDFTGLDLSARNLLDENFFDPPVDNRPASLQKNIDAGNLGVKSGRGFYDYTGRNLVDILNDRDKYLLKVMDNLQFCLEKDRLV
ncbi:3-hydroxyacyl-CoA dehydrogenase family protein [Desulfospira joergensenii]|uniref:3-hydroxyacyl-CoA dehydrogenase family protein n=1 Tax=Desulfospira joergensenii TaxID=53329 RepID=UPI0003B381BD|nr:3-hydroxyacyl-CoA dehydrogenase family protein [Desulfospira joergensenii]